MRAGQEGAMCRRCSDSVLSAHTMTQLARWYVLCTSFSAPFTMYVFPLSRLFINAQSARKYLCEPT